MRGANRFKYCVQDFWDFLGIFFRNFWVVCDFFGIFGIFFSKVFQDFSDLFAPRSNEEMGCIRHFFDGGARTLFWGLEFRTFLIFWGLKYLQL